MRTILATFLTILMLLPVSAMGEILTIKHTVKQTFGGGQSPDDARIYGIAKAKREAMEKAGTYIESLTVVKDSKVEKDEILALTAGVLKAEVISQKNYASDDAFGIEIVVNVVVDTSVLEERVKKLLQDRTHLDQLNQSRKKEKELLDKVAILEKENRRLMAKKESSKDLKKQFQDASRGLTAVDWVDIALALFVGDKFTDPQKAIECLNEAIRLKPDYARAYMYRGGAYSQLGQYDRAIPDSNEAVRLTPKDFWAFFCRGDVYRELKQYQRAIDDYSEAIRLNPSLALLYHSRGAAYKELKQYQRGIEDFNAATRLDKDDGYAYNNRGIAYSIQGDKASGCSDFKRACELEHARD